MTWFVDTPRTRPAASSVMRSARPGSSAKSSRSWRWAIWRWWSSRAFQAGSMRGGVLLPVVNLPLLLWRVRRARCKIAPGNPDARRPTRGELLDRIHARLARPLPALALSGTAVIVVTLAVVRAMAAGGPHPELLADALTLDLLVTAPLAYWFLAVRGAGWPRVTVVPVFVLSVAATRFVPGLESGRLLPWLEWVAIPAELLLLTIVARRAIAMSRALARDEGDDAFESLRRAAEIVAYEAAILWCGVAGGGRRGRSTGGESFGVRRKSGYGPVLIAILFALVAEGIALHLFVRHWSAVAAWILTILTAYGAVWLLGDFRALGRRTIAL